MKVTLQWLNDYVDHKLKVDELVHRLTMAGLEVEDVYSVGASDVFEMEITPNRPDCLSVIGIAREGSAICQKKLKMPHPKAHKNTKEKISIQINDANDCGRYIGTVIKNVQIKESPKWLKDRIEALGMKSINNVVDITNFCLMEFGQPLHAFDFDKIQGEKIIIRRAHKDEQIKTLDGQMRKIDENILVIADANRPVALAGIMGGEETQITLETKNVLLESAHFSGGLIRRSTRAIGLTSDSAYRFERSVHWDTIERCSNRAIDMILEMAGGNVYARRDVVSRKPKSNKRSITVSLLEIENLLGVGFTTSQCKAILTRLGFNVKAIGVSNLKVEVPDFRNDISQPVDVIEELARIVGFDNLPMTIPQIKSQNIQVDISRRELKQEIYGGLIAQGCSEIVTYSMTNQKSIDKSHLAIDKPMRIVNPLSLEQECMRPSLLPGFLNAVLNNANRGEKNLRLFENGRIYFDGFERDTFGILMTGQKNHDWRNLKKESVDIFDLKGVLDQCLKTLRAGGVKYLTEDIPGFETGQSARCYLDNKMIGFLGRVASESIQTWDIKTGPVYFSQIDVEELCQIKIAPVKFKPIPEFPSVNRDISLAVGQEISYEQIESICLSMGGDYLKSVRFIEQYVGDKIQNGMRGLVFSLTYQSQRGTLKEEEVNSIHDRICHALTTKLGAVKR
jgi:phenylalanyl-tRNA synthetase beta chain